MNVRIIGHRLGSWESFRKIEWGKEAHLCLGHSLPSEPIGVRASGVGSLGSVKQGCEKGQGCPKTEWRVTGSDPFFLPMHCQVLIMSSVISC